MTESATTASDSGDVLIVGAGPTGLMLANQLVNFGIKPVIIDRNPGPALHSRALGVQARTLEIYAQLGLAKTALALGKRATGANLWANGKLTARIPLGAIGQALSPFPYLLILGQDDNEQLLRERLQTYGVAIEWNSELTGIAQSSDAVLATIDVNRESAPRRFSWVAGCDGARSAVRGANNIEFVGAAYTHTFFVADCEVTGSMRPDELNVYLWRQGFHLFFPMRGEKHWRVVGIVPETLSDHTALTLNDVLPSLQQEVGLSLKFARCDWFSTYPIHHRRASAFKRGRCFVLGDAAHVHSPVGAQGMNTGIQDAYNLGWKLALVMKGRAQTALLDSYAEERMPIAKRLLATTDSAFSFVVGEGLFAQLFRTQMMARLAAIAMRFERIRRLAFLTISQTGIHYRASSLARNLVQPTKNAPCAGDRLPWIKIRLERASDGVDIYSLLNTRGFTQLVFGDATSTIELKKWDDLIVLKSIPDTRENRGALYTIGIAFPSYYLVRPDGYIGLTGRNPNAEDVAAYLRDHIHLMGE